MAVVTSVNPAAKPVQQPVQKKQLPYLQDGQLLPVQQPLQFNTMRVNNPAAIPAQPPQPQQPPNYTPQTVDQGNVNVMGAAQNLALQTAQQPNPTMGLVQQQTNQLLQQPELITDKYIQNQLGVGDRNRADQMRAFQQQYADVANTGAAREKAYNFAMEGAQQRTDLENTMRMDQALKNRDEQYRALNLGQEVSRTASGLDTEAFNRLIGARGVYEGERSQTSGQQFTEKMTGIGNAFQLEYLAADQAGQRDMAALNGKISKDMLLTTQDFQGTQNSLDRALSEAKMKGDWASVEKIQTAKNELDLLMQNNQIRMQKEISAATLFSQKEIAGMEIASREKMAGDENVLKQAGIDLEKAQLFGYDDPKTGKHIYGTAEIAGMRFGLESDSLDMQKTELFGGMVDTNGDGVPDKQVQGKYDLLSNEDKREADQLYGYEMKDAQGNVIGRVAGSLELEADKVQIMRQGLDLDVARVMGYDKNGVHIPGELELNFQKYGLQAGEYADNRIALFGGINPTTGESVKGKLQMEAEELGLKGSTLELQRQELFGYTDGNGVKVKGKYDLMSDEQKREADRLYGYTDPVTGKPVKGEFDRQKELISIQYQNDLKKLAVTNKYETALLKVRGDIDLALQNDDQEHAAELMEAQFQFTASESRRDRAVEWAKVELEKRGVAMDEIEQNYNIMLKQGNADAAFTYISGEMAKYGIKMEKADEGAVYEELERDFKQQQYLYALSNPDAALWVDKIGTKVTKETPGAIFKGLVPGAEMAFNSFLNDSYYGPDGKPAGGKTIGTHANQKDVNYIDGKFTNKNGQPMAPKDIAIALRGSDNPKSQNNAIYQQLYSQAAGMPQINIYSGSNTLGGVPPDGSYVIVSGRLMLVTKGKYDSNEGRNHEEFELTDVSTGSRRTFTGLNSDDNRKATNSNIDNWGADLAGA